MLYVLQKFPPVRVKSLVLRRVFYSPPLRLHYSDSTSEPPPKSTSELSDDDLRRIHEAAGSAIRRRERQTIEPFVRPHRKYRTRVPYQELEWAFEVASEVKTEGEVKKELWDAYINARCRLKYLPSLLSERAWEILWQSQEALSITSAERARRLKTIASDREKAGFASTLSERLAKLDGLFKSGQQQEALKQWEYQHKFLSRSHADGHRPQHMELGARMLIATGNLERATLIINELFDAHPTWNLQVNIELFLAYLERGTEPDLKAAFSIYDGARARDKSQMTFHNSEKFFRAFLKRRETSYALKIYRDMIMDGNLAASLTHADVVRTLKRFRELYEICSDVAEVNDVSLTTLSVLPHVFHNNIFKKWLMEMAARGETESAGRAVELMYERGITPRAVHYNLLIALLLRSNEVECCSQAESIAWQMIDERQIRMNLESKSYSTASQMVQPRPSTRKLKPFFMRRAVPPADSGTYARLVEHYTKGNRLTDAASVLDLVTELEEIVEDSDEILRSAILFDAKVQYFLASGQGNGAWTEVMRLGPTPPYLRYNSGLYVRLWKDLKNTFVNHDGEGSERPEPRLFMAHMVTWYNSLDRWERHKATQRFKRTAIKYGSDLPTLVATAFKMRFDLPGSLVSMHVLYKIFGLEPTRRMIRSIFQQLVNFTLPSATAAERRENARRGGRWEVNMAKMIRVYQKMRRRRLQSFDSDLSASEDMEENDLRRLSEELEQHSQLTINTLSDLVRYVMVKMDSPDDVKNMIRQAQEDIGVSDLSIADANGTSMF